MRELSEIRKDIDRVDESLKALFSERLGLSREVAEFKKENSLPIYDREREEEKLEMLLEGCSDPFMKESMKEFFCCLIEISKRMQEKIMNKSEEMA